MSVVFSFFYSFYGLRSEINADDDDDKSLLIVNLGFTLDGPVMLIVRCSILDLTFFSFLLRDAVLVWYMLSSCVRPSVCPSNSGICRPTKMAKRRITQTTPYDSHGL